MDDKNFCASPSSSPIGSPRNPAHVTGGTPVTVGTTVTVGTPVADSE
jgi:hypothetical protein